MVYQENSDNYNTSEQMSDCNNSHSLLLRRFQGILPELVNLTTQEAAIFLRVSHKKLEADRLGGRGPPFRKHCSRVTYCLKDLLTYLESNTRQNTCK